MHGRRWIACLAFVVGQLMLCVGVPAYAEPAQASLGDVVKALGMASQPSDYVVVVDTSKSMQTDARYQRVVSALGSMLGALKPSDRVSLVTFESVATVRYRGLVGTDPKAVLGNLPASPGGVASDIGAGIAAGLAELERADASASGAILLFTDGKIDAPTSPYAKPSGRAWAQLKVRAERLQSRHEVDPLAIGLASNTDAALLKQVFSGAIDVPAGGLSPYLTGVSTAVLRLRVAKQLEPDLAKPVAVFWGSEISQLGTRSPVRTTVTLRSGAVHVPLVVTGARGIASEWNVDVAGLPAAIALQPGESLELSGDGDGPPTRRDGDQTPIDRHRFEPVAAGDHLRAQAPLVAGA